MDSEQAANQILDDEGLAGDLDEAEATILTSWLVGEVQKIAKQAATDEAGWKRIKERKQLARKIAHAVALFRDESPVQASQYAKAEQLKWPTPPPASQKQALEQLLHSVK